ncbi:MAG: hypothetical protein QJR03_13635 [Sphaerobacter sp.]|nr:hypothetical protein [Sphaerobacter sp.]
MVARLLRVFRRLGIPGMVALLVVATAPTALARTPEPGALPAGTLTVVDLAVEPTQPAVGDVATVRFSVRDAHGAPVSGLSVTAELRAPAARYGADPAPILTAIGQALDTPGAYEVAVALNQAGRWWIDLEVADPLGRTATASQFVVVAPTLGTPPATTATPLFLRSDAWGAYYRLDPATGSLATLSGQVVLSAAGHWWVAGTRLVAQGPVTPAYGGTWHLSVELRDGLTGQPLPTVDLGDIRASVNVGSADQPAISTSLALAPDGSRLYLYWARQLGEGWMSHVAVADPASGAILLQRELQGAVVADVVWGSLTVSDDGAQLVLAERATQAPDRSGYRLTVLEAATLATVAQHRRIGAPDDPLTACILPYPGPTGPIPGDAPRRYSLCNPEGIPGQPSLVIWDPIDGTVRHQVTLDEVAGEAPFYVDGVASPDGVHFYAVNTATRRVLELDMQRGAVLRSSSLAPGPDRRPSTFNRFVDWIFGLVVPSASAGVLIEPGVTIAPDGRELYPA